MIRRASSAWLVALCAVAMPLGCSAGKTVIGPEL
jgi:hypothetical protein